MPYSKSRRRAATAGKPKRRTQKKSSVSKAVKKYVRRSLPAVELKNMWYHDDELALNSLTQGYLASHPYINQGTPGINRIGNEINLKMIDMKGALYNNSGTETYVRLIVVGHSGDLDPTMATFPMFRTAASGTTSGIGAVNGLNAMYFPTNKLELKVYVDRKFRLAGSATAGGPSNTTMFHQNIKFPGKGLNIKYKANATGVGNQNRIISVFWCNADANDDTSTGTVAELSCLTRIWYTDC